MKDSKVLWNFMKGNRIKYIGAIICVGIVAFLSTLSPLVIRTTIDSVLGGKPMELPKLGIKFVNYLGGKSFLVQNIWVCSLTLVLITLVQGIFVYLRGRWSAEASEDIAKKIKDKMYAHIQNLPYEYHVKCKTGDLIQRCTTDIDNIRRFLYLQFVNIGKSIFILIFSIFMMLKLNVKMALIAMICVPIIFIYSYTFFNKIRKVFKRQDEAEAKMTTVLQENLSGVRVVRAFGRQKYEIDKFDDKSDDFRKISYESCLMKGTYWCLSNFLCMFQIGVILVVGVYFVVKKQITIGTLFVFMTYEDMLLWPVRQLGRILADAGKMTVSLHRINEILKLEEEKSENNLKPDIKGNIEFKNVYFEYEKDLPVLKNISFNIKEGETIGIIGKTGSGKSSLVHLLARLYDYDKGSIKIDGVELKDIDRKWIRSNVGIVLQEPFLFSKTIKENIILAKDNAKENEIYEAANIAAIHNVILNFDNGYETIVGEKGVTLSGGQRQRVAIARTVINKSPILVFDDSLSAVDTKTDKEIREALNERSKDVTTIMISHRISTLKEADKIIVLKDGEISDIGTHLELINKDGLYKKIWDIQNLNQYDDKNEKVSS